MNRSPALLVPAGLHGMEWVLRVSEPALLILCSILAYLLRLGFVPMPTVYIGITLLGAFTYVFLAGMAGLYQHVRLYHVGWAVPRILGTVAGVFAVIIALMFLLKISTTFSRVWLVIWLLMFVSIIGIVRFVVQRVIWQNIGTGQWARRVAVLGVNDKAFNFIRYFDNEPTGEARLMGIYGLPGDNMGTDIRQTSLYKGDLEALHQACKQGLVDDVIITLDFDYHPQAETLLDTLYQLTVNIYYCLPLPLFGRVGGSEGGIAHIPLMLLFRRPLEGPARAMKRGLDIVVSALLIFLLAPVLLLAALAVKLSSPGPVFFKQKRNGFNGDEFGMYKFRSMRMGEAPKDAAGKEMQATKEDPRITAVGRILRRTSIDELPQLLNILHGDMSLVGPRPHAVSHNTYYENLINRYASRHKMKPGLTGWAQVSGLRGETETVDKMAKRVEYDIWYIENWSFWMDIRILILTPLVVLFQKQAY
ncbi:MAG: undecaprenyl-phosphate glucose phosphotransferase [Alphaproteobacteria bacterium]